MMETVSQPALRSPAPTRVGTASQGHQFAMHDGAPAPWPDFLNGQPGTPVRVLLVETDPCMRFAIAQELLADCRIHLLGQGDSLREGRRLMAQHEFEVLLVDLRLSDGTGLELIAQLKDLRPFTEAIALSGQDDETHAVQAFRAGATGFLVKNSWFRNFPRAVLEVVNGGAALTPNLTRRLLRQWQCSPDATPAPRLRERGQALSEREKSVLRLVAGGLSSPEIGNRLTISAETVNTHVKSIYRKLQVRSRAQAVNMATHRGLL
jgi:DNA-binding NarL/FixJ family response regulator